MLMSLFILSVALPFVFLLLVQGQRRWTQSWGQESRRCKCALCFQPLKHEGTSNYLLFSRDLTGGPQQC